MKLLKGGKEEEKLDSKQQLSSKVITYKRLSPLVAAEKPLIKPLRQLGKGDCIVAFSRRELYSLKNKIENQTDKRCCIM
jgi:ATP-dependent RNA helicase SUPV3L1/SUV3